MVVDRFSKETHLIPCCETITASQLGGELFSEHIFRLHGLPKEVVSDRGPQFIANFWKATLKRLGIKRHLSSAHHQESDGQTERANETVEQYLSCFVNYHQNNWVKYLAIAEFALNNSGNASTKQTPLFVLYGRHPTADQLAVQHHQESSVPASDEFIETLTQIHEQVKHDIAQAQEYQKNQADQQRSPHTFAVGDQVWLLRRFIKTTRPCAKLDNHRLGPFTIVEQINDVAFRLQFLSSMAIHDVFHVPLLEPYHANIIPDRVQPPPPSIEFEGDSYFRVKEVLQSRWRRGRLEYLVDCEGFGPQDRSLEPAASLTDVARNIFHERFPDAPSQARPPPPRRSGRGRRGVMSRLPRSSSLATKQKSESVCAIFTTKPTPPHVFTCCQIIKSTFTKQLLNHFCPIKAAEGIRSLAVVFWTSLPSGSPSRHLHHLVPQPHLWTFLPSGSPSRHLHHLVPQPHLWTSLPSGSPSRHLHHLVPQPHPWTSLPSVKTRSSS